MVEHARIHVGHGVAATACDEAFEKVDDLHRVEQLARGEEDGAEVDQGRAKQEGGQGQHNSQRKEGGE